MFTACKPKFWSFGSCVIVPNGWNIELWDNRSWHNIVDSTTYVVGQHIPNKQKLRVRS